MKCLQIIDSKTEKFSEENGLFWQNFALNFKSIL